MTVNSPSADSSRFTIPQDEISRVSVNWRSAPPNDTEGQRGSPEIRGSIDAPK